MKNYSKQECINCETIMQDLNGIDILKNNIDAILWCPDCGTILKTDPYGPISLTDWRVAKLNELNVKVKSKSGRIV